MVCSTATMFVLLFSQYCANDRAVPSYLSANVAGSCLAAADQTTQSTCLANQDYTQQVWENTANGNVYYVPCGVVGQPTSTWVTPTYQDGPPCQVGVWPCSVTTFSLFGYTMQEYCTGEYGNSEQFPFHAPPTSSTNCMPIAACSKTQQLTIALQTGQDPTNPASYFVFLYNCNGGASVPGYSATTTTCGNFSQYSQQTGPIQSGTPQKTTHAVLSNGGIAGVVVAFAVVASVAAIALVPGAREFLVTKGNEMVVKAKGLTGNHATPA